MSRLMHQLLAPLDPLLQDVRDCASSAAIDEDLAIGFECAYPALQFDSWEPASASPQGPATVY